MTRLALGRDAVIRMEWTADGNLRLTGGPRGAVEHVVMMRPDAPFVLTAQDLADALSAFAERATQ